MRLRILAALMIAAGSAAWFFSRGAGGDRVDRDLESARALYKSGDYEGSTKLIAALLESRRGGEAHRLAGQIADRRLERGAAREHYLAALERHRKEGDHLEASKDAHLLAGSYWLEEQHRSALESLMLANQEASAAKDMRMQGFVLMGVGDLLYEVGDAGGAEKVYAEARPFLAEQPKDRAWLELKEGILHFENGRPQLGRARLEQALELGKTVGRLEIERSANLYLGQLSRDAGNYDQAAEYFARATELLDRADDKLARVVLLHHRAILERKRGRYEEAQTLIEDAKKLATAKSEPWRLFVEAGRIAEAKQSAAAAKGEYEQAIEKLEALREQLALDELRAWFLSSKHEPYEALFSMAARSNALDEALLIFEKSTARTFLEAYFTAPAENSDASLSASIERAENLRSFLPRLNKSSFVAPRAVEGLREAVRGQNILAYYSARDELWILASNKNQIALTRVAKPYSQVVELAERWLAKPDDDQLARELGALLLPPKPAGSTLLIIASGILAELPFAALIDARGRRLIEDHVLSSVPSFTAFAELNARTATTSGTPVVIGNEKLPGSIAEAKLVAELLHTEPWLGAAAGRKHVSAARDAAVVHFSTHATQSARGPAIELGDGMIDATEILDWRLKPKVLVLAACASGTGAGADLTQTLAGLFLAAGAAHVVATLRSIDDQKTVQFMRAFYEAGGANDPARALAAVQRNYLRTERPSTWASFAAWGIIERRSEPR